MTMTDSSSGWEDVTAAIQRVVRPDVDVVPTALRPRPLVDVRGRSVAYFCAAPQAAHERLRSHLETAHGLDVAQISGNLADRQALRVDLEQVDAEVYIVELKAAAIDVVAEAALERGVDVVLAANDVVALASDTDLDERLLGMAKFAS